MGTRAIKQKIMAEAEQRIAEIRAAAAAEVKRIKKEGEQERAVLREQYEAQTEAQAALLKQRLLATARFAAKQALLAEREAIIDEIIQQALTSKGAAYQRFLKCAITNGQRELGTALTITCSPDDETLVKRLASGATITTALLSGGVILTNDEGKRIDERLESLLERRRGAVRQYIVEALTT